MSLYHFFISLNHLDNYLNEKPEAQAVAGVSISQNAPRKKNIFLKFSSGALYSPNICATLFLFEDNRVLTDHEIQQIMVEVSDGL